MFFRILLLHTQIPSHYIHRRHCPAGFLSLIRIRRPGRHSRRTPCRKRTSDLLPSFLVGELILRTAALGCLREDQILYIHISVRCTVSTTSDHLQCLVVDNLDDWSDALLRQFRSWNSSKRSVAEEQRSIIAFRELRCFSDGKGPDSDSD